MSDENMPHIAEYLKRIEQALRAGNATEHTHRPALKALVESLAAGMVATNEPKRVRCGAPDFIVTRGATPLGYIEAKDVGKPLDREERSEQMERYRQSLGNLILTDYLEFRWYVGGEHRLTARLAREGARGALRREKEGEAEVGQLLAAFLVSQTPTVGSAKELAERMAGIARLIRDTIRRALSAEDLTDDRPDPLHEQLEGFRQVLLHDLTEEQFADMYAQTICYGLFAARCSMKGGAPFTREQAAYQLPKTNPFLRRMFAHIAGPELDESIAWAVDDLAELLNRADIAAILQDFGQRTRREDPVVHFYETFLAAYDPRLRETRGVYYTPEPVVSYIVRSVDSILKTDFKLGEGLADASRIKVKRPGGKTEETHRVLILDPATGTGTFLYGVINRIYERFQNNRGLWSAYVSEHLLPRLFGFELLMAPYAVAHMKLGLLLDETGYDFQTAERLRVYLTNTLEEAHAESRLPLFAQWLADEANEASRIKQEAPVMVVLGNPPYSGHSENRGTWIKDLLNDYKAGCPELKKPAQAKWLSDDYVKFIRFAQWRIEQTGYGVLAFISNHGYLDNPTFRCMRQSLMETFDDIYLLDLHGNSKKKERAPDGSKDENVFDIQQGVAIGIFVKRANPKKKKPATVRHVHLWGLREVHTENEFGEPQLSGGKYHWLWQNDLNTTEWTTIQPDAPLYLFSPRDTALLPEYETGWKVPAIFSLNGDPAPGIVTTHDEFAISWNKEEAATKVERLLATESEEEARSLFRLCTQDQWQYRRAKVELRDSRWREELTEILYRPYDFRWTVFNRNVAVHRRERVMRHMLAGENIGLITTRQTRDAWHVLVTNRIIGHKALAAFDINSLFPLYLYPSAAKSNLFDTDEPTDAPGGRRPNLAPEFVADCAARLKLRFVPEGQGDLSATFGPEDVFAYLYAVFHSPAYRRRYAEFLKIDFPRLPLTANAGLFRALVRLGRELVGLHLLEASAPAISSYPQPGDNTVEFVRYTAPGEQGQAEGRVWINRAQYFAGVTEEVWNFHVGGYQVASKWLKDRKGRRLTYDDLTHYQRVVAALAATLRLMTEIDRAIDERGGWPIH